MYEVHHIGTIKKLENTNATIVLNDALGCTSCALKSNCGQMDSSPKEFEVIVAQNQYKTGDNVQLTMKQNLGLQAVLLAYIVPFVLMISVLIISGKYMAEWLSGLLVIAFILLYFVLLKAMNPLIKKHFSIQISKVSKNDEFIME